MMAMYKNSILGIFYCYFALTILFQKTKATQISKIVLFVTLFMLLQYFISLTNITSNYPIPFNESKTPF